MVWVTFRRTFNFVPPEDRRCAVKYPAGYRGSVRRVCAEMAKAAGALEEADVSRAPETTTDLPDAGA